MKTRLLLAATIATGLAFASAAFAADDMNKPGMSSEKMDKKTDAMSKDKMKTNDAMMDKKDSMAKDGMKK